jgi:predicted transcriptional regulator
MNSLTIDLPSDQFQRLHLLADKQGLSPEEFARQLAAERLTRDESIDAATQYLLKKNAELYRRLAK